MLAVFFNEYDLERHSTTSLKIKTLTKQNYFPIKCALHNLTSHAYGKCTYAGSYMHLLHDKQETSLNVRGGGDSQNFRRFLEIQIVQIKKALSSSNITEGGGAGC